MAIALLATLCALVEPARATGAVPSPALMAWSFSICNADTLCSTLAFPANGDLLVFEQMMLHYMDRRPDDGTDLVAHLEVCALTPPVTECSEMWLWQMRDAIVCDINEEWIEGHGCQCIEGRNCQEDCLALASNKSLSLIVFLVVLGVFVAVVFAWIVKNNARVFASLDAQDLRVRDLHAAVGARLYVQRTAAPPYKSTASRLAPPPDEAF